MEQTSELQDAITKVVRVLLVLSGGQQKDLAGALGVNASGITRRMKHGAWTIEDLDDMARFFNVPITTFFRDPRDLFEQGKRASGWIADSTEFAEVTAEY
jgi:transcriptional regulator with XRE-family HTH domain